MGFDVSYQKAGLNRCGEYLKTARTKGPELQKAVGGKQKAETEKRNEPWRRISDLVGKNAETRDPSVRRRCVRKLVAWIDRKVSSERLRIENCKFQNANLTESWGENVSEWRRVACGGMSVEGVCFRLGISKGKLDRLLREGVGISAGELLDGFKIRGLRKYLMGQMREAAYRLWGRPGYFAQVRCLFTGGDLAGRRDAGDTAGKMPALRRSRYFRTRAEEFFGREAWEEEEARVSELLGMLDRVREENEFSIEAFAVRLGFESAARFRRGCLNVMGRTLEQLERILAREIVLYYLAAEDLELREICRRDDVLGFRGREVYWGSEEVPAEPFLDRWSANLAGKPEWIEKMREEFG